MAALDVDDEQDEISKLIGRRAQDHSAQEYSAESIARALALCVRPTDVFIATAPKGHAVLSPRVEPFKGLIGGPIEEVIGYLINEQIN